MKILLLIPIVVLTACTKSTTVHCTQNQSTYTADVYVEGQDDPATQLEQDLLAEGKGVWHCN